MYKLINLGWNKVFLLKNSKLNTMDNYDKFKIRTILENGDIIELI